MVSKLVGMAVISAAGLAAYSRLDHNDQSQVRGFTGVMSKYADVACHELGTIDEAMGDYQATRDGNSSSGCVDNRERARSVLDQLARTQSNGDSGKTSGLKGIGGN